MTEETFPHKLTLNERKNLTMTGVNEVVSFDENLVRLVTVCGVLNLEGEGFRVHVLNLKEGTVAVTGQLNGVLYEESVTPENQPTSKGKSRSRRLFG